MASVRHHVLHAIAAAFLAQTEALAAAARSGGGLGGNGEGAEDEEDEDEEEEGEEVNLMQSFNDVMRDACHDPCEPVRWSAAWAVSLPFEADLEIADTALYRDVKKSFPHVGVSAAQAREHHRGRWEGRYTAPPHPLPPYSQGEAEAFAEQMTAALSEGLERSAVLAMAAVGAASPQDLCRRQLPKLLAHFQVPPAAY